MAIGLRSEEIVERIQPDTDLVGVTCMFSQDWPEIRRMITLVRRRFPGIPIVAGGSHITATLGFTLDSTPEIDACAIGQNLLQHRQESRLAKSLEDLAHRVRHHRAGLHAKRARATV